MLFLEGIFQSACVCIMFIDDSMCCLGKQMEHKDCNVDAFVRDASVLTLPGLTDDQLSRRETRNAVFQEVALTLRRCAKPPYKYSKQHIKCIIMP